MPLFDLSPKDSPRALYGRSVELDQLVRLTAAGRWTIIQGPRMVGKTSLAKAALNRLHRPAVYVNLWGAKGTLGLLNAFVDGVNANRSVLSRMRAGLRRIEGLSIGPAGIALTPRSRPLRTVWDLIGLMGEEAGKGVIVLDEIQELAPISGVLLKVLGNLFNTRPGLVFVFTGSYFGLTRTLLDPETESPLFGRPPVSIRLDPFDRAKALQFLERGLAEYHLKHDLAELGNIVDRSLDGVPGWLTLFGNNLAVQGLSPTGAENAAVREGLKVVRSELAHFFEGRPANSYWQALRILTAPSTWSELRQGLTSRRGSAVNDHSVGNILRSLRSANLVVEQDHQYVIPDPMVRKFVREARNPPSA